MCALEEQGGTEVQLHASLTSLLGGGEGGVRLICQLLCPWGKSCWMCWHL